MLNHALLTIFACKQKEYSAITSHQTPIMCMYAWSPFLLPELYLGFSNLSVSKITWFLS